MLLKRAMRYYRLWIYACNVALLASVVGFACVAGRTLADPRRALIPAVRFLYQPTFLYAYLALIAQGGAVQVLGCIGALRLNERLLELYWLLLFLLLCGDVLIGLSWILRFDQICAEIKPTLQARIADEYSSNADFTDVWDTLQRSAKCCGVAGPRDFLPLTPQSPGEGGNNTTIIVPHNLQGWWGWSNEGDESILVPQSCCRPVMVLETTTSGSLANETIILQSRQRCEVFSLGCEQHLVRWLRSNSDMLLVIGYCVVAFVKLTFLGILHYEIREMLQKIKLMQQEREAFANSGADLTLANHYQALPTNLPPSPVHMNHLNHAHVPSPQPTSVRQQPPPPPVQQQQSQPESFFGSSPPTSLQAQMLCSPSQFSRLPNHLLRCGELDGNNSDTGSHCALISLDCKSSSFDNNNKDTSTSRQTQI
ncbi:uncharacterized protein LOC132205331 [Neocloeon triangulifer]|uniref:uncharacterized protein LOC132205331 n=1 Tax=Neocloeon triangulifer TaxID=2078957 RepID=UPI00286F964A|nr:uncharacterized protein LOC132205331 [Neocloeon triangulifer]